MKRHLGNPLLVMEWRRFRRRAWGWTVLILAVWVPPTLMFRTSMGTTFMPLGMLAGLIFTTVLMMFRPDILIGFFLVYRGRQSPAWRYSRTELAATLLSPLEILTGKAALPVLALLVLNGAGSLAVYGEFVLNRDYTMELRIGEDGIGQVKNEDLFPSLPVNEPFSQRMEFDEPSTATIHFPASSRPPAPQTGEAPEAKGFVLRISSAWLIAPFALLEDFLYALVVILIAMREFLFRENALAATFRAFGRMALVGLGIAVCGLVPMATLFLPWSWQRMLFGSPGLALLAENAIWFACVLPFEIVIIRRTYKYLKRRLPEWLYGDTEAPLSPASSPVD